MGDKILSSTLIFIGFYIILFTCILLKIIIESYNWGIIVKLSLTIFFQWLRFSWCFLVQWGDHSKNPKQKLPKLKPWLSISLTTLISRTISRISLRIKPALTANFGTISTAGNTGIGTQSQLSQRLVYYKFQRKFVF